jgi:hypothetical protein
MIKNKQPIIKNEQSIVNEKQSMINQEQSIINEKQSIIKKEQSMIKKEQSIIKKEQSMSTVTGKYTFTKQSTTFNTPVFHFLFPLMISEIRSPKIKTRIFNKI